jgi:exodeoxyribonuclease X
MQSLRAAGIFEPADYLPFRDVCTQQCAKHMWPDAPRYSNQVLRYYLDLAVPRLDYPPHRAPSDAVVTSSLIQRMLDYRTVPELVAMTTAPVLLKTCMIGQWRGRLWADVDPGMLRWILARDFDDDVKHTCRFWLAQRNTVRRLP